MLLQRWLFWILEQASCLIWPKYCLVTQWLDHVLCRMSCHLDIEVADPDCTIYHQSWVHCHVSIPMRHPSYYVSGSRNPRKRVSSNLYQALRILQDFWRQLRCSGTHKASKALPSYQAHQCLLPSFSQACDKLTYQNLPSENQRSDRQRST